ncbi:MAG: hypothetical protein PHR45_09460, partial [Muribaculaceae bacterium]|nr:hypothetical protein [Muribaculaceae bacterium]
DYDGRNGSNVLVGDTTTSQRGERGSNGDVATRERVEDGKQPAYNSRGAESGSGQSEVNSTKQPAEIGNSSWGKVFQWAKGKVVEAANFLKNAKSGYLKGVFYRRELGEIDLFWGNDKGGLAHIIAKHVIEHSNFSSVDEAVSVIDDVISTGEIIQQPNGRIAFVKEGKRVVTDKTLEGNWVVTAFDETRKQKEKKRSEEDATRLHQGIFGKENGELVSPNSTSTNKDTQSNLNSNELGEKVAKTEKETAPTESLLDNLNLEVQNRIEEEADKLISADPVTYKDRRSAILDAKAELMTDKDSDIYKKIRAELKKAMGNRFAEWERKQGGYININGMLFRLGIVLNDRQTLAKKAKNEEETARNDKAYEDFVRAEEQQKIEAEEKHNTELRNKYNGFIAESTQVRAEQVDKILSHKYSFHIDNNEKSILTLAEYIEHLNKAGKLKLTIEEEYIIKDVSDRRYFRMDAKQQDAFEKKREERGKKKVYYVNGMAYGKIAYDYAKYISEGGKLATPESQKEANIGTPEAEKEAIPTEAKKGTNTIPTEVQKDEVANLGSKVEELKSLNDEISRLIDSDSAESRARRSELYNRVEEIICGMDEKKLKALKATKS